VSHHIRVLERDRQVVQRRFLGFNRIFSAQARSPELALMPLLRDSLVPHLLERIRQSPGIGIQALSKELSLGRKVVRRQLLALVESGLLQRSEHYRPRFYLREEGVAFLQRHLSWPGPVAGPGDSGHGPGRDGGADGDRMPALRP
jgi:predicted transcriptional regulator